MIADESRRPGSFVRRSSAMRIAAKQVTRALDVGDAPARGRAARWRRWALAAAALVAGSSPASAAPGLGPSAAISAGQVRARDRDDAGALGVLVLRAGYGLRLDPTWALAVDFPILGLVTGQGWSGEDQSSARFGAPLVSLRARTALAEHLFLTPAAGLTLALPKMIRRASGARDPEWVIGFVSEGEVYSALSAQEDRSAFQDRWVTLVAPLELRYDPPAGAFAAALVAVEAGPEEDLEIDLRVGLEAGYRTRSTSVGLRLISFRELVHKLGRTARGEVDFAAGRVRQHALEPSLCGRLGRVWICGRATLGTWSSRGDGPDLWTAAAGLDAGVSAE
jgi:hypothetical protein